jgi:hypothetical protein
VHRIDVGQAELEWIFESEPIAVTSRSTPNFCQISRATMTRECLD